MTAAFQHLPIVDVSGLFAPEAQTRARAAAALGKAAREAGFLYCTGHGIAPDLIDRLIAEAKRFFARPLSDKMRFYIGNSANHSGYVPMGEEAFYGQAPDRKEAFDVPIDLAADDPAAASAPLLGPVQWPNDVPFRDTVAAYYDAVAALARLLFTGFALAMELPEDWFESRLTVPPSQLRLVRYPFAADAPADQPGIGAHTDYECFTILLPTAPGLEVMNGAGDWIDAPPVDGAFVVNISDMLEVMTNGAFTATSHRVRRVAEERYSFPFFAACDYHTVIAPLPHFVSAMNPARYRPLVSGDHLLAQTAQTFAYFKRRIAAGSFTMPGGSLALSSFGNEARTRAGAA